jgi:hypothetical protein
MTYIILLLLRKMYDANMKAVVMLLPALTVLLFPSTGSSACTVCHSKNPEMRRMHEALGYKDCFTCHGPSANPFDRAQRQTDHRCIPCHK